MELAFAVLILLLILMTPASCQQTAEDWFNNGSSLIDQGKYNEAIKAFDEAIIKLDPNDPNLAAVWSNKGTALAILGKYNESIWAYNEAIRLDPKLASNNHPKMSYHHRMQQNMTQHRLIYYLIIVLPIDAKNRTKNIHPRSRSSVNTYTKYPSVEKFADEALIS